MRTLLNQDGGLWQLIFLQSFSGTPLHTVTFAMISCTHSFLFVCRHVDITLDGCLIFTGELKQAPGNVAEAYQHAEHILFTEARQALEAIEQHDAKYLAAAGWQASPDGQGPSGTTIGLAAVGELDLVTEAASPRGRLINQGGQGLGVGRRHPGSTVTGGRPLTAANLAAAHQQLERVCSREDACTGGRCSAPAAEALLCCRELVLVLLDTYGDSHFVGLTGLEVIGADGQPLQLGAENLWADPPDLNVFPGNENAGEKGSFKTNRETTSHRQCSICLCLDAWSPVRRAGDVRTLDKILDGHNNTMDDTHMWLAPIKRQIANRIKPRPLKPSQLVSMRHALQSS